MGDMTPQITQQGMAILYIIVAAFGLGMCFTDIVNELQKEEPKYGMAVKQILILMCYLSTVFYAFVLPHVK